jgi:hypothetical protein
VVETVSKEEAVIDRPARDRLVVAIESFLNEENDSAAFDYAIWRIASRTGDAGIEYVVEELTDFYDERPGKARLTRDAWNYVQRLRLFLQSDCQITFVPDPVSFDQPAAAALLILVVVTALWFGRSPVLHLVCLVAALELWMQDRRRRQALGPYTEIVEPFVSIEQLAGVYRRTPTFQKRRYPHTTQRRRSAEGWLSWLPWSFAHLAAGIVVVPFHLLVACFRPGRWCVVEPTAS